MQIIKLLILLKLGKKPKNVIYLVGYPGLNKDDLKDLIGLKAFFNGMN